ncbi:MAG: hypothetical protein HYZ14_17600 [Bacteroidetes bacterium]|nr:hypothetical protein [Bacteroidota bacterium]
MEYEQFDSFSNPSIDHLQGFLYSLACMNQQLYPQEDVEYHYYFFELYNQNNSDPKELLIQLIGDKIKDISENEIQLLHTNSNLSEITSDWKTNMKQNILSYFAADVVKDVRGGYYCYERFLNVLIQFLDIKQEFKVFEFKLDMNEIPYNFYYQWGMDFKSYLFIVNTKIYYLHFATALG